MTVAKDKRTHRAAARHLARRDPILGRIIAAVGPCGLAPRDGGLPALVDIIAAQQVSKYAAESIRGKLRKAFGDPVDAARIAAARPARLRGCGLSRAKATYIRALARAVVSGDLDFELLHALDDDRAIERLVALKGIGRWTAEIYLMFVLTRPDLFPIGDGALRTVIREAYALAEDAADEAIVAIAQGWSPYRTVASWYLYAWINRRRAQARQAREARKPAMARQSAKPATGESLV